MKQIFASVTQEIVTQIEEIAQKDGRTFSQTVKILLERAIKERNRKKKDNG
jgi:metal-responsive CopG/Arc/MetJ family transcriptional regulator